VTDKSGDQFTWGVPDVEGLLLFCQKQIGWRQEETKRLLDPVMSKIERGKGFVQTRLDSFMTYEDSVKFAHVRSKRLRDVLGLEEEDTKSSEEKKTKRHRNK
jgi:hypothetical protein